MKKDHIKVASICLIAAIIITGIVSLFGSFDAPKEKKPGPDAVIKMLQQGNYRFANGKSTHPNMDKDRLIQAGKENQGDYAYATVITCSDSQVPVELVFDAGIMDIFVIRVAGNVCDTDEVGSIEYGLAHVNTPVLVVLGHTQCGAVTAVTHAIQGKGHALELNIPPLVDNITPAVLSAMEIYPHATENEIIPLAIEQNVWTSIRDLFMKSPASRQLVKDGKVKVVGAIYDVGTGKINWLKQAEVTNILHEVEADPNRAMNAMAPSHPEEGEKEAPEAYPEPVEPVETTQHG
jgi:carbonic anhydrase